MTEDDAIQIARNLIHEKRIRIGNGVRVVDLERHLAKYEQDSGRTAPERIRGRAKGIFVVWFEIPHAPDVVITPGEIGVEVDSRTGNAVFQEGCL
jgi:hypothetical protein